MYDGLYFVCRYTAIPYASTLRHVNDNIARVFVSTDMRSHQNQCSLWKALIELLQPPIQLGFFLIPFGKILQRGTDRIFELRVNVPPFALQSLRKGMFKFRRRKGASDVSLSVGTDQDHACVRDNPGLDGARFQG